MQHLVIVDGYGFVFRAYFAIQKLSRKDGKEVGAVYGFTNMLIKLLSETDCTHIVVVFDSGGKNFRHNIYPEYKAHRPPAPEDLIEQFPIIRHTVNAFNIKSIELGGYEADDIIATLATKYSQDDSKVTIVSSDKDLMQLVGDHVYMYDAMKSKLITEKEVIEKFGVPPIQVRDMLSIMGDSSDNVPGVKGIGPKGALDLVTEYGSIENIINSVDDIAKKSIQEKLKTNIENLKISYELIGLEKNVPLTIELDDLKKNEIDYMKLIDFLEQNQFRSIISRVDKVFKNGHHNNISKAITQEHFINNGLKECSKTEFIGYLPSSKEIFVIDMDHSFLVSNKRHFCDFSIENLIDAMKNQTHIRFITFNHKALSKKLGFFIDNYDDLQLMAYILDSSVDSSNISNLLMHYLEIDRTESKQHLLHNIFELEKKLYNGLIENKQLYLYNEIEKNVQKILYNTEITGIMLDTKLLYNLSEEFKSRLSDIEKEVFALSNEEFNIGSPKQLSHILFEKLDMPKPKMLKSGYYSTDAEVLENLSINGFTIADKILEYRHISKLNSTYTYSLAALADKDSRVHTTYMQNSTITGRLSSINPNLQNIPIRTEEGQKIRKAFIAKPGYKLVSCDYSQIELRVLAHMANITPLIDAFKNNLDIHTITASHVFKIPIEEVTSDIRRKAKAVNFGIIYGISSFGLAKQIGCSRSEAKEIIDTYLQTYSGIKQYMDDIVQFAKAHEYVMTIMNRRCYIKNINASNQMLKGLGQRLAINAPIQGSAADIMKKAMIDVQKAIEKYDAKIVLQIHDELVFEVREDIAEKIANIVKTTMEQSSILNLPLVGDVEF